MRVVDRIATVVLALVLLAGGLLLVIESARVGFGRPAVLVDRDGWYSALAGARLNSLPVRIAACAVTALGLLIVATHVRRWRPRQLAVQLETGTWYLRRRSVERRLSRTVAATPGVRHAEVRVAGRGDVGTWRPRVRVAGEPPASEGAALAARGELDRIGAPTDRVRIDLDRKERR